MQTQDPTVVAAGAAPDQTAPVDGQVDSGPTADNGQVTDPSEGIQKLGWRRQLPQEYWEHDDAKAFGSSGELFRSYLDQKAKLEGAIVRPGENATEEDLAAYFKAKGVPESPDGYQITTLEGMPEEYTAVFAERAHAAKLEPEQAAELYRINAEAWMQMQQAEQARIEAAEKELRDEWKGDYDQKVERIRELVRANGGDELIEELDQTAIGSNPKLMRFLSRISELVSEDAATAGGQPGSDAQDKRTVNGLPILSFQVPG